MKTSGFDITDFRKRRAQISDAQTIVRWFTGHADAILWGGSQIPNPLTSVWFERELADDSYYTWVDGDGTVVAVYSLINIEEGVMHLRRFGIAPMMRGKGLGKEVIREIVHFARSQGAKWLSLWVYGSNEVALKFYESVGFREISQRVAVEDCSGTSTRMRFDL